jgi:protein TonB
VYGHGDWDFEDSYPSTSRKIVQAIKNMERTYTKVEHPPEFPGGSKAWEKYIGNFCAQHRQEIDEAGSAEVTVQFIVHMKGQVEYVEVVTNPGNRKLGELAVQAVREGPAWIPANQNGRVVVCYKRQAVKME